MYGLRRGMCMSDSSDRMSLILQELSALDSGELNLADRQKRREEICCEIKELAKPIENDAA
jgi:hypothetical protein